MRTLGIWDGHNASVAAVEDGRILAAVAEERLTRCKMQRGFPFRGIPLVLSLAGWAPGDVDKVAMGGRYGRLPIRLLDGRYSRSGVSPGPLAPAQRMVRHLESLLSWSPGIRAAESAASAAVVRGRLRALGFPPGTPLELVPHHLSHAAGAASMLGSDGCVLTMDGYGDGVWATLSRIDAGGRMTRLMSLPYLSSIAVTYGAVCQALGFREGDEGKVTALAASGDPARLRPLFASLFGLAGEHGVGTFPGGLGRFFGGGIPSRAGVRRIVESRPEDAAAALQEGCERFVMALLRGRLPPGTTALALAGGLFANVSINRRVVELLPDGEVQVFPPMTDQGLSLGAALAAGGNTPTGIPGFESPFLGDAPEGAAAARLALQRGLAVAETAEPERRCAETLAAGGVVALVTGREEFGPRALGNRSLLFPATSLELADRVQSMLRRSRLMPFAPVCRQERARELFLPPWPAPDRADMGLAYMTFAVQAKPETRERFPAAVHVDGTARVQVVTRSMNPRLWEILDRYEKATGLPLLTNTSFNLHGEPIVHAEDDALATFVACGADLMLLGNSLIRRTEGRP